MGPQDRRKGPRRDEEVRATRKRRVLNSQWTPYGLMLVLLVGALWRFDGLLSDIRGEGIERRDQTCLLFERAHQVDVDRLRRTYSYLVTLDRMDLDDPLNRAVQAQLPQVEADARGSRAPSYCDAQGVGLPEPNPEIPVRPAGLR